MSERDTTAATDRQAGGNGTTRMWGDAEEEREQEEEEGDDGNSCRSSNTSDRVHFDVVLFKYSPLDAPLHLQQYPVNHTSLGSGCECVCECIKCSLFMRCFPRRALDDVSEWEHSTTRPRAHISTAAVHHALRQ